MPIPVNFADEPAMAALRRYGRDARSLRDLYVQMQCYCKRTLSDGFVPAEQIGLLVYPDPPKVADRDVKRLMDAGIVELAVGGYYVPDYLGRNPTRARVEKTSADKAKGVQAGNHQRWHVDRGESDPRCELCQAASPPSGNGKYVHQISDERTDDRMTAALVNASVPTDSTRQDKTRQDKELTPSAASRGVSDPSPDQDPDFTAFWAAYPRKRDKKPAFKVWLRIMKRKIDPKEIIAGAERYQAECDREHRESRHIKLPATWLNGDCWTNEDESEREIAGRFNYPHSPWDN